MRLLSLIIALLCLAPLLLVASSWVGALPPETASNWQHVREVLLDTYLAETLLFSVCVLAITVPLGVGAAWFVTRYEFRGRRTAQWMLILPIALPGYVSAFAYGALFDFAGPIQTAIREYSGLVKGEYWFFSMRNVGGAAWVMGFALIPYMYLIACTAFASQPQQWQHAAQSLGTSSRRFFWRIALPAARPFVAAGAALVLMEALADIGTVGVLGVSTLSSGIYRTWANMQEPLIAARLATFLLGLVFLLMLLERASRRNSAYSTREVAIRSVRTRLPKRCRIYAYVCCWLPVLAGFVVPVGFLLRVLPYSAHSPAWPGVARNMFDSVIACSVAGFLICGASLIMVLAERRKKNWLRYVNLFATLGYAVPGVVIAVGFLMLLGWLRESASIMLVGSIGALFAAYVVRYLAVGYNPLHGGAQRIPPELDMAAASLGSSPRAILKRVHLPLLRLPLCTAFLLVALDIIKELPITLILRPFGFKTLALSSYDFASDDRAAEAAPYALSLLALSCLVIFILHRVQKQESHHGQH